MEESISVLLKLRYGTKSERITSRASSISTLRAVFAWLREGAGRGRSSASGVDHRLPRRLRVWLALGTRSRRRAELAVSVFSRMLMGGMLRRWCSGSRGAVRKDPEMILTASFWTSWSFLTRDFCLPLYQSWHPYVRTGRH